MVGGCLDGDEVRDTLGQVTRYLPQGAADPADGTGTAAGGTNTTAGATSGTAAGTTDGTATADR